MGDITLFAPLPPCDRHVQSPAPLPTFKWDRPEAILVNRKITWFRDCLPVQDIPHHLPHITPSNTHAFFNLKRTFLLDLDKQPRNNSLTCTDCIVTRNFVTCQYCLLWIKSNRYFWTIPFWRDIALTFVPLSIAKPAKHGIAGENKWSTYNMHVNICELSLCFRKTGSESLCHNKTSSYSSRIYHPITPRVKAFRFCCYIIIQEVYTRGNRYK